MAKVMISVPDPLLARIDACARGRGTTRSGLLRELAEAEMATDAATRLKAVRKLLAAAAPHGGANAVHLRERRRGR